MSQSRADIWGRVHDNVILARSGAMTDLASSREDRATPATAVVRRERARPKQKPQERNTDTTFKLKMDTIRSLAILSARKVPIQSQLLPGYFETRSKAEWRRQSIRDISRPRYDFALDNASNMHQRDEDARLVIELDYGTTYTGVAWTPLQRSRYNHDQLRITETWPAVQLLDSWGRRGRSDTDPANWTALRRAIMGESSSDTHLQQPQNTILCWFVWNTEPDEPFLTAQDVLSNSGAPSALHWSGESYHCHCVVRFLPKRPERPTSLPILWSTECAKAQARNREAVDSRPHLQVCISNENSGTSFSMSNLKVTMGAKDVARWKKGAGKNKSWKRCPKMMHPPTVQHKEEDKLRKRAAKASRAMDHFSTSPLWIPHVLVQDSRRTRQSRGVKLLRYRLRGRGDDEKKSMILDHANETPAENDTPQDNEHTQRPQEPPHAIDHGEPRPALMRLTWTAASVNGVGSLERFLAPGLSVRSRWRIARFLRNDSHADVYAMVDALAAGRTLEGHYFLPSYQGNGETYAKRHKRRMRGGGHCVASFWFEGRDMLIMRIPVAVGGFRMRSLKREFPPLDTEAEPGRYGSTVVGRTIVPSYADIVRKSLAVVDSADQLCKNRSKQVKGTYGKKWKQARQKKQDAHTINRSRDSCSNCRANS
ncbi:hypothetical protein ACN47E_009445 [Coniothyrium glycines]